MSGWCGWPLESLDESCFDSMIPSGAQRIIDRDLIARALATLRPEQTEVVLLHHPWGFSFVEIAGILGCSTSAAKVRAHRTMKQLRTMLGTSQCHGEAG